MELYDFHYFIIPALHFMIFMIFIILVWNSNCFQFFSWFSFWIIYFYCFCLIIDWNSQIFIFLISWFLFGDFKILMILLNLKWNSKNFKFFIILLQNLYYLISFCKFSHRISWFSWFSWFSLWNLRCLWFAWFPCDNYKKKKS